MQKRQSAMMYDDWEVKTFVNKEGHMSTTENPAPLIARRRRRAITVAG